jgi:flagellar biosynthetic protein FliP
MLIAGMGVVAALAFVLGLGALCVYGLKRWGTGALRPRSRVAVEVVQRVQLGPKTGLAVVRVGEKVMALSVGEGGVRQLFELDEADRQRVIATSTLPQLQISSAEATAAFAPMTATSMASTFGTMLGRAIKQQPLMAPMPASVVASTVATPMAMIAPVTMAPVPFSMAEPAEVPRFLTAPATTSAGAINTYGPRATMANVAMANVSADRDFRSMLGVSMSGATRLVVFAAAMITMAASSLHAQAATGGTQSGTQGAQPPVVQPPTAPVAPTLAPTGAGAAAQTARPAAAAATPSLQPPAAPRTLDAPPLVPADRRNTRASSNVRGGVTNATAKAQTSTAAAQLPRTGNGAATTNRGTSVPRPMSQMVTTPAQDPNNKAAAATPAPIAADDAIMRMMPQMDVQLGGSGEDGGLRLNGTVGVVVMMGLLTLLPTLMLMMTGFTRILIVLQFLKQAMGTQSAPPGALLAGMALLLTGFVMGPTLSEVNRTAITPWMDGQITQVEMMKTGVVPLRTFMLKQTRQSDVETFVKLSRMPRPNTVDDVPLHVLMSAFVASELRTAFQIGFAIYLPFIIIDAVVASVLMSMGMFMLPPAMISLPFKLLLFVLVDGWSLTITSLVQSFK